MQQLWMPWKLVLRSPEIYKKQRDIFHLGKGDRYENGTDYLLDWINHSVSDS